MRSFQGSLRATLRSTDRAIACYAGEFVAYNYARLPRRFARRPEWNGLTPYEARVSKLKDSDIPRNTLLRITP